MMLDMVNLYRQAERYFFKSLSEKHLDLKDGNAYLTGVPTADLNLVYVESNPVSIDSLLKEAKHFFDQNNLPFVALIPKDFCAPDFAQILNEQGYVQTGQSFAMGLSLENFTLGSLDSEIQEVGHDLNVWIKPLINAFDSTPSISAFYVNAHESALKMGKQFHHFSLIREGQTISSVTLSLHNNLARVDDLGTIKEFQGQGFGTKLILHALSKAKALGASHCFLESADSGFSVYKKLNFQTLFQNNIYSYSREV